MRSLVLYYSTTVHTRTVATLLAEDLGAEVGEISCPSYHTRLGWLVMAWDIFARRRPSVELPVSLDGNYDLVVLGGPVWAGRPAPPVVSCLTGAGRGKSRYGLFVTCGGTNPKYRPKRRWQKSWHWLRRPSQPWLGSGRGTCRRACSKWNSSSALATAAKKHQTEAKAAQ